jgi:phosphoinositide-3-kinase regulatory subunit 4
MYRGIMYCIHLILMPFSLGSTRFFKVARAKTKEGLVAVKVFVIHDPSLPLKSHRTFIEG